MKSINNSSVVSVINKYSELQIRSSLMDWSRKASWGMGVVVSRDRNDSKQVVPTIIVHWSHQGTVGSC